MTLHSLHLVAEAVEKCAQQGLDVSFEIKTRQMWRDLTQSAFAKFRHAHMVVGNMPPEEYRSWLANADALVIAYNFDAASIDYVRYSLANKLPECLASGAPLIAVGPSEIETLATLDRLDCSIRVREPNVDQIIDSIWSLANSTDHGAQLAAKARKIAFEGFDIADRRTILGDALASVATAPHQLSLPAIANARPDESLVAISLIDGAPSGEKTFVEIGGSQSKRRESVSALGWTYLFLPIRDAQQAVGVSGHPLWAGGDNQVFAVRISIGGAGNEALRNIPWRSVQPAAIVAGPDASGQSEPPFPHLRDAADLLRAKGYTIYLSQWRAEAPSAESGVWLKAAPYSPQLAGADFRQALLAFRDDPGISRVTGAFFEQLRRLSADIVDAAGQSADKPPASTQRVGAGALARMKKMKNQSSTTTGTNPDRHEVPAPAYAALASKLHLTSPRIYATLRFFKRALSHFWARRVWTAPASVLAVAWALAGFAVTEPSARWTIWGALAATALLAVFLYIAFRIQAVAERFASENLGLQEMVYSRDKRIAATERAAKSAQAANLALQAEIAATKASYGDLSKNVAAFSLTLRKLDDRVGGEDEKLRKELQSIRSEIAVFNQRYGGLEEVNARLEAKAAASEALSKSAIELARMTPANNAALYQRFNRRLSAAHVEEFVRDWRKRLSVNVNSQLLGYMATRACQVEAMLEGRLATSIEDVLLRTTVCLGVKSRELSILEIGTLFGIGAAIMHDSLAPHFEKVHLTLLDPLDGYYDSAQKDVLTGQPINEATLLRNLDRAGVARSNLTLIKRLSTDVEAIREAGLRQYDVLVIDGDHSYAGVKTDFENYSPFVRLGGFIVIDDYGSPDWPDVTRFVDEEVSRRENVAHVGTSWRTCVYRVVKPPIASIA